MSRGDFGASSQASYGATEFSYHRSKKTRENDDFNDLCDDVSGKIFLINKNISRLEHISQRIDQVDEKEIERKIHELCQETNKSANEVKSLFKDLSQYTQSKHNLMQNKLCKEFENSLSRYHAIQNVVSLKMKAHIQNEKDLSFSQDVAEMPSKETESLIPITTEQCSDQLLEHEHELAEAKEREERLLQIEEDILNVNEIFRDLALLVHEQGDTIDSIESNIEHAALHVEEGNKELVRAKAYQRSARKRLCCIALIATVLAIILSLIIYYSLN